MAIDKTNVLPGAVTDAFNRSFAALGIPVPQSLPAPAAAGFDANLIDPQTLATIEVLAKPTDKAGEMVPNIASFSYTSDIQQLGDPFSLRVPDPYGNWRDKLADGKTIRIYLANPNVQGGTPTLKVTGIIVDSDVESTIGGGTVINLTGADLGWHLIENDAPIWFNQRGKNFEALLNLAIAPQLVIKGERDPGWGFRGVRLGNDVNAHLKLGPQGARIALQPKLALNVFEVIETSPGEKLAELLQLYARRLGLLVNVSGDGYLQTFTPNYNQDASYRFVYHRDDNRNQNNVKRSKLHRSIRTRYTDVLCLGQAVYTPQEIANAAAENNKGTKVGQGDIHAGKFRGVAHHPEELPFTHRKTFGDAEQYRFAYARFRAEWAYQMGKFNGRVLTYTVRDHWQNGKWFEADTLADVDDDINGIHGQMYVSAVHCNRDEGGDVSEITLHEPNLLGA